MGAGGGGAVAAKTSRSQRKTTAKAKNRQNVASGLMLTSMLDILTVVLFFLLKIYSSSVSDFATAKDISLPRSSSLIPPVPSLQLVVTQEAIILDDQPLVHIVNGDIQRSDLFRDGVTITKLAQALAEQKKRSMFQSQTSDKNSFAGTIVLQADKNLTFNLLKKVIYTAGVTDFVMLKLAVMKKDDG